MASPTRHRDTAIYQRLAVLAHVTFLIATLVTFAVVGEVVAPVIALAIGTAVFAAWAIYMLRAEAAARHDETMAATAHQRNTIDRAFASERRPVGPPSAVPSTAGTSVVAAVPVPPSNPIRQPVEPAGE
jgi:small neutral amino acid transporter SnatA (MarC family)